jgi:uncharacterized protein
VLISFRLENHRSIRDEQAFSMEPGRVEGDGGVREDSGEALLSVAAIYGPNASGKSNLLSGLAFMRSAVVHSHRFYPPEGGVPRRPFAWGPRATEPSLFEVVFRSAGVRFEYGFVADDVRFLEEWLYAYPTARKQVWFERDGDDFKFGEHLKGENRVAEKVTRPNSLFLSAAAQNHHEQLSPVFRWFSSVRAHNVPWETGAFNGLRQQRPDEHFIRWWTHSTFDEDPGSELDTRAARFRKLLHAADFGIVDLKVSGEGTENGRRVLVKHQNDSDDSWLPLEEESHGTRQLFRLAPSVLDALALGSTVLVDELEASLHPLLALQLVRAFNDPKQNLKSGQLLFSTHDTNLLGTLFGTPPLRRDQVWLTEKDTTGATRLYPLTDYKPRKAENLERGYLQGRYGAIPFLENIAVAGKAKG